MTKRSSRGALWLLAMSWISWGRARAQEREVALDDVLAFAEAHAPLMVEARARLEEGEAARIGASPLLTSGLSVTVGAGPRFQEDGQGDVDFIAALSQSIEVAGERGTRLDAADRLASQRDAELEAVRWQVHRQIHLAYHHGIHDRARVESEARWIALGEEVLRIATERAAAGEGPPVERVIAQAELARARQRQLVALAGYRQAVLTLAEVSGWDPQSPPAPVGQLHAPDSVPEDAQLLEIALAGQPLLRAAAAAVATARANLAREDRGALPALDLGLQFSREGSAGSPANYIGILFVGVSLPVWQQNTRARAAAEAALSIAEAQEAALRAAIQARVLRAASTVRLSAERLRIYEQDVVPGFETALSGLSQAYQVGEIDLAMLSAGRQTFLAMQVEALAAYTEYHDALAELETELGTEIDAEEHAPSLESASPSPTGAQ